MYNQHFVKFKKIIQAPSLFFFRLFNNNKDFTLISIDCMAGVLYNQYGLRFLSPTINIYFDLKDFLFFCNYLHQYIEGRMENFPSNKTKKPRGLLFPIDNNLPPIRIHFQHYDSFEQGAAKWEERKKRINWNNIYVVARCIFEWEEMQADEECLRLFRNIPYKKVIFTKKKIGFDNEYILPKWAKDNFYKKRFTWKRAFNCFNFNKFLKKQPHNKKAQ